MTKIRLMLRNGCYGLCLLIVTAIPVQAAITAAPEYQIKAVFLYNLAQFVSWPAEVFHAEGEVFFDICVLGEDPFQVFLDATVRDEKVNGHEIKLHRFDSFQFLDTPLEHLKSCEILFVSYTEVTDLEKIFTTLCQLPILTVSDVPEFTQSGGMVKFFTKNNKIRLAIAVDLMEETGLKADANLLRLSEIIERRKEEPPLSCPPPPPPEQKSNTAVLGKPGTPESSPATTDSPDSSGTAP